MWFCWLRIYLWFYTEEVTLDNQFELGIEDGTDKILHPEGYQEKWKSNTQPAFKGGPGEVNKDDINRGCLK